MVSDASKLANTAITPADVASAMIRDEFYYCYQPKTSFETGDLVGAEALIRWRHNDELIPPGRFIGMVEENGLAPALFEHMIPHFLEDHAIMREQGIDVPISINVSPQDLKATRPADLLHNLVHEGTVAGADIQIEITEGVVLVDDSQIKTSIKKLLNDGIQLLMDDFGTGYSSIDVLSKFPYSYVKIDMGLVSRMASNLKSYRIIKGILHLTRDLNIMTVAEGVETMGDYQALQLMGCNEAQGFLISPGIPVHEFAAFANKHESMPSTLIGTLFSLQASLADYRRSIVGTVMFHYGSEKTDRELAVTELAIEHDPKSSRFGKWYYGIGQALGSFGVYEQLEEPHQRMREVGLEIVEAAYKDHQGLAEILTLLESFNTVGNKLDALMGQLIEAYLGDQKQSVTATSSAA